jgi:tRNA 2-thiouridine synthesizing protein E
VKTRTFGGKKFKVDSLGFLLDFDQWDRVFVEGMASAVEISGELTSSHWAVLDYIRGEFSQKGRCPQVFHTSRACGLGLDQLRDLFPTGYLRGACLLAGIPYERGFYGVALPASLVARRPAFVEGKTYEIDTGGFLVDPNSWDARFATLKASEMKMPEGLTKRHWGIIHYLRDRWAKDHIAPNVYTTCKACRLTLEELERLFPDGYQRGAIKIAGLRLTVRDKKKSSGKS